MTVLSLPAPPRGWAGMVQPGPTRISPIGGLMSINNFSWPQQSRQHTADDTASLVLHHRSPHLVNNDELEACNEAATNLIEMAGFDLNDSDYFGDEMGSVVHPLLALVMQRVPQLRERINEGEIRLE